VDFANNDMFFFCMLWVVAQCEKFAPGSYDPSCIRHADDESSFLQLTTQTASARTLGSVSVENVASQALHKEASEPAMRGSSLVTDDPGLSTNPFTRVAYELARKCPMHADQASCNEAIWLGGLLSKLSRPTSSDLIAEAGKLLSLGSWFQNPAGPAGFFNFLDKNHDGILDADELLEYGGVGLMQVVDLDHDKNASRQECQTFLRGCAVLFKMLPTKDSALAKMPAPVMLKLADTVTLESAIATGPSDNPLLGVASSLEAECPEPADKLSCREGVELARYLANMTAGIPPNLVLSEVADILALWSWFQHPQGPAGFFNSVDIVHKGSITASELAGVPGSHPAVVEIVKFMDKDTDGKASRAECQTYLRGCVMLLHKLPTLDLLSASTPLPDMFDLADSVIKQAVTGSSPLAWALSMSASALMITCILYVHCCPRRRNPKSMDKEKDQDKDQAKWMQQEPTVLDESEYSEDANGLQIRGDHDSLSASKDSSPVCSPSLLGPPRMGTMYESESDCPADTSVCYDQEQSQSSQGGRGESTGEDATAPQLAELRY